MIIAMMKMKKRKKKDEEGGEGEEDEEDDDEEEEGEEEEEVEKEEDVEVEVGFTLDGAPYPKWWEFAGQEAGRNGIKRFDPSSHTHASENDPDFFGSTKWPSKGTNTDRKKSPTREGPAW